MEIQIQSTELFKEFLRELKDPFAKAAIISRVQRLKSGLQGDAEPAGDGITELRIHVGKGYRVYYKAQDKQILIILCAGNKKTQTKDIKLAKKIAKELGL